ncbi:MAG: cation diffusion facilitator family transporter [Candidatus Njordarchaeota archaeon]
MSYPPKKLSHLVKAKGMARSTMLFIMFLFAMKLVLGYIAGSVALIADAYHSLSDSLMVFASYLSLRIILSRPNKKFQYGYYRAEDIVSLFMAIGFTFLAMYVFFYGYNAVISGFHGSKEDEIAAITAAFAGALSIAFSHKQKKIAREAGVTSLAMSSKDLFMDGIVAFGVSISVVINKIYHIPFEGYAAMVMSLFILSIAIKGGKIAVLNLLDVWSRPDIVNKIKEIINKKKPLIAGRIRLRRCGPIIYGDAIIYAPEEIRLEDVDDMLEELESEIYMAIPELQEIVFEVEPLEETKLRCVLPIKENNGLQSEIEEQFEAAKKFLLVLIDTKGSKAEIVKVIDNVYLKKRNADVKLAKRLIKEDLDCVIVRDIGEVIFELFKAYSVDTYVTKAKIVEDAISEFLKEKLTFIEQYEEIDKMES